MFMVAEMHKEKPQEGTKTASNGPKLGLYA
jgi:hypothetical protein